MDVQPDETFRLRNDHDRAGVRAVYGTSHANVGKVGQGDHIEDPPNKVGLVAEHLDAELPAGPAMRSITADEVPRLHRLDPVLVTLLAVECRYSGEDSQGRGGQAEKEKLTKAPLLQQPIATSCGTVHSESLRSLPCMPSDSTRRPTNVAPSG